MKAKTKKQLCAILHSNVIPGILLILSSALAMIISNTSIAESYQHLVNLQLPVQFASLHFDKTLFDWVNDGLMVVFFTLVGLEIKREIMVGELSSMSRIALPTVAACGGMLLPGLIFYLFNQSNSNALQGWAIPTATDIAFAIGILVLLGDIVPKSLRMLLATIAIIDDLLAILIIGVFYSEKISFLALLAAAGVICVLLLMNKFNVRSWRLYAAVGFILWLCILSSGLHATLTGVILALIIPLSLPGEKKSPAHEMEFTIRPWVSFLILPIFALVNAGVNLTGMHWHQLIGTVPLGIMLGLFVGKQLGVFGFAWLAIKFKLADKPCEITWAELYGLSILCGVGFTMSMFIGGLAYDVQTSIYALPARLSVLLGSLLSAVIGYAFLYFYIPHKHQKDPNVF